jgi:hypothetical protein
MLEKFESPFSLIVNTGIQTLISEQSVREAYGPFGGPIRDRP